jgi:outer membrane receptor for ferrienterochelin and colicins
MNILYRILFILFIVPSFTHAQTISLFENETTSVPGAHLFCKNLDNQKTYTFFSDADGKVHLKDIGSFKHLAISIYALGFERLNDTLSNTSDKKYFLKQTQTGLNELVITAQYAPNDPEKAVHAIRIIDAKKITAMAAVTLKDVLTNELNIRISQDNILGSSMKLQGVSGQNVKILMDGVPMIGRLNGDIDISQINMNNVERIEIVEGPLSVSYGTDALGGTINIITKKGQGHKISADVQGYYESYGQYNLNANVGYNFKNQSIRLSGGRNFFDGWNPGDKQFKMDWAHHPVADSSRSKQWNPKESYFGSLSYGYKLKDLQFYYTLDYFNEEIKNRGYPEPHSDYVNASDDIYKTTRLNNSVSVDGKLSSRFRLNGVVGYNYYKRNKNTYVKDLSTLDQILSPNEGDQDTSVFKTFMSRATISNYNQSSPVNYEIGYDAKLESTTGARIKSREESINDYALFGSLEWKAFKNFVVRPGLRLAYNTDYKAPLIPSLNVKYTIPTIGNGSVNIRGSYARGFRAPTLTELYFDFVDNNHTIHGNENLKAEYSNNFSLAVNYMRSKGDWSYKTEASAFYTSIKNKIGYATDSSRYDPTQAGVVPLIYLNIDQYKSLGVQFQQSVSYKHLKVTLGASYIGTYNDLSTEFNVSALTYSPEVKANVFYEWHQPDMTFGLFYKFNGKQNGYALNSDGTNAELTTMAAYSWADCSISKMFFEKKLNVAIGSKNIFNIESVAQTGASSSSSPHSSGTGATPIGSGRTYFITMTYHFRGDK